MSELLHLFRKDLLIEWRSRSHGFALACFALTLLLLFSFAIGPDTKTMSLHAGAYLWMSLLLSSTLLLARSFQVEVEDGAIETLILAPASATRMFYAKALANAVQLAILAAVAVPAVYALYGVQLHGEVGGGHRLGQLVSVVALGAAGLAAPGTLYAALTARLHARQLLLPLLLFPLVVPCLLAAVKATTLIVRPSLSEAEFTSWLALLACFDVLYWSVCGILFGRVIEQ